MDGWMDIRFWWYSRCGGRAEAEVRSRNVRSGTRPHCPLPDETPCHPRLKSRVSPTSGNKMVCWGDTLLGRWSAREMVCWGYALLGRSSAGEMLAFCLWGEEGIRGGLGCAGGSTCEIRGSNSAGVCGLSARTTHRISGLQVDRNLPSLAWLPPSRPSNVPERKSRVLVHTNARLGRWGRWSILRIQPWSVHNLSCCSAARARASSASGTSRGGGGGSTCCEGQEYRRGLRGRGRGSQSTSPSLTGAPSRRSRVSGKQDTSV